MIIATVIGPVWSTKRVEGMPPGALLEVEEKHTSHRLVALDQLGSGPGDDVLVALGSAVSRHLSGGPPLDALIVGVLDERAPRVREESSTRHHEEGKSSGNQ